MPAAAATPETRLFPIADITIPPERQREKAEADASLLASLEAQGLLNPIVIHANGVLVAGERRLDGAKRLGWTHIRTTIFETLPPRQAFLIELQENLARKQLTWQEECKAIADYHQLRMDEFAGWTQRGTAQDLGISDSKVSQYLLVARELADDDVRKCPTFQGAFNLVESRAERALIAAQSRGLNVGAAAVSLLKLPPLLPPNATKEERTAALKQALKTEGMVAETVDDMTRKLQSIEAGQLAEAALRAEQAREVVDDIVLCADFIEWASEYSGPRFDVLHVDFPYGKGYSGARTRRTGPAHIAPVYADNPDVYFGLVDALLNLQDRLVFPAAHCLFWFDMMYYQWTVERFEAAGWTLVQPYPFIWTKGYQGVASDPKRRPRHCYETALIFSRGDRKLCKLDKDHFECQVEEKLHLSQKPNAMLKHLLGMYVDEHTAVLDPTCGSGSALVAATQLRANRVLGVELDPANADVARFLLQRNHVATEEPKDDERNRDAG